MFFEAQQIDYESNVLLVKPEALGRTSRHRHREIRARLSPAREARFLDSII